MIVNLCLNPSYDINLNLDSLVIGDTNLVAKKHIKIGGKGINFCRALDVLDEKSKCILMLGIKNNSYYISKIQNETNINFYVIDHSGEVRSNIKLFNKSTLDVTEINEKGNVIDSNIESTIIKNLENLVQPDDFIVLSGSIPDGITKSMYSKIIEIFKNNKIVVDTSGEALLFAVKKSPYIIKPNLKELEQLVGRKLFDEKEIIREALNIKNKYNIKIILLSNGINGSFLFIDDLIYKANAINTNVVTTVGAGDTMLASFLYYNKKINALDAFINSICFCTSYISTGIFNKDLINNANKLKNKVFIKKIR